MNILNMLKNKALNLTNNPGVYLMKNSKETIIYIGKAKNLKNRVVSYFRNVSSHNEKIKKLIENVVDFDFVVTKSEVNWKCSWFWFCCNKIWIWGFNIRMQFN